MTVKVHGDKEKGQRSLSLFLGISLIPLELWCMMEIKMEGEWC